MSLLYSKEIMTLHPNQTKNVTLNANIRKLSLYKHLTGKSDKTHYFQCKYSKNQHLTPIFWPNQTKIITLTGNTKQTKHLLWGNWTKILLEMQILRKLSFYSYVMAKNWKC